MNGSANHQSLSTVTRIWRAWLPVQVIYTQFTSYESFTSLLGYTFKAYPFLQTLFLLRYSTDVPPGVASYNALKRPISTRQVIFSKCPAVLCRIVRAIFGTSLSSIDPSGLTSPSPPSSLGEVKVIFPVLPQVFPKFLYCQQKYDCIWSSTNSLTMGSPPNSLMRMGIPSRFMSLSLAFINLRDLVEGLRGGLQKWQQRIDLFLYLLPPGAWVKPVLKAKSKVIGSKQILVSGSFSLIAVTTLSQNCWNLKRSATLGSSRSGFLIALPTKGSFISSYATTQGLPLNVSAIFCQYFTNFLCRQLRGLQR